MDKQGQSSQELNNKEDDSDVEYEEEELFNLNDNGNRISKMSKSLPLESSIPSTQQPQDINSQTQPSSSQLDVTSGTTERSATTNQIPITDHISASEAAKKASNRDMSERDRLRNESMEPTSGLNDITNTLGTNNINAQSNDLKSTELTNRRSSDVVRGSGDIEQSPGIVGSTGIMDSINNLGSKISSFGKSVESFSQSTQQHNNVEKCERIYKSSMSRDEKVKELRKNNCEQVLKNEQARLQSMSGYTDKSDKILDWFLNNSSNVDQERKQAYDELVTNGWKTGWHFSDPSNWFKSDKRYKCYTNTACKACPLKAETWPVDVMERDAYQVLPEDDFTRRYNNLTQ